ncbi:MAG TPA: peptidoglycan DD-metalloendopeptidase family protein [Longimicrobiales bacterium]
MRRPRRRGAAPASAAWRRVHARPAAVYAGLCTTLLLATAAAASAQDSLHHELRESQLRLEEIRKEREELQREMQDLRSRVSDVSGRLENIERRAKISADALRELEFQSATLAAAAHETTGRLIRTRDRLTERKIVLRRRLRSIYKRGPLHAVRVLLSAKSFGDLLTRYKYLHLIARYDRALLEEVGELERQLAAQEQELVADLGQLQRLRAEKLDEFARLQTLEREQQLALRRFRARERQAEGRLAQLARDEARLTDVIADLERKRKEEERRRVAASGEPAPEGTITTSDLGALDWPVDGRLVYRFGPQRKPNGVLLRWNGIGIGAPPGTPVRAVEAGTVMMAGPFEGYGPSVMVSHGGGYYTLYLYLGTVRVQTGQQIIAGQVIGTVGGERTPEGPHVEFQVRAPIDNGIPEPVDPLNWLRARAGQ